MSSFRRANRKVLGDMPEFLKFFIPVLLVVMAGAAVTATAFTQGWWWLGIPAFIATMYLSFVVAEMGLPD